MKIDLLPDEEYAKRAAPGGRLPVKGAKSNASGGDWVNIGDASPAAIAAKQERIQARSRPALAAKRGSPVFK
jgi:hypothetical protein